MFFKLCSYAPKTLRNVPFPCLLISGLFYSPQNGDIVIVQMPTNTQEPLVKRVIATEGQHIKIDFNDWKIWIDGKLIEEDYINYLEGVPMSHFSLPATNGVWEGTVPEGKVFVLGDNRNNSQDSRSLGYIDERWLVGRVVTRLSPLDRFGKVD